MLVKSFPVFSSFHSHSNSIREDLLSLFFCFFVFLIILVLQVKNPRFSSSLMVTGVVWSRARILTMGCLKLESVLLTITHSCFHATQTSNLIPVTVNVPRTLQFQKKFYWFFHRVALQLSVSCCCIYAFIYALFFGISFPLSSPQSIEQRSLCYTVLISYPFCTQYQQCLCQSQSPNSAPPYFPLGIHTFVLCVCVSISAL